MRLKVADCQPATLLKWTSSQVFFKDFDCKFQNTYFPEHLSSGCFCRAVFRTIVNSKNQWRNQYWKRVLLNKNYEMKCLNTRWCFRSTKIICKVCYLTYCWHWRHKNIQKVVLHYPQNDYLQYKNSTIVYIYLTLQLKDKNEASYVQGAPQQRP